MFGCMNTHSYPLSLGFALSDYWRRRRCADGVDVFGLCLECTVFGSVCFSRGDWAGILSGLAKFVLTRDDFLSLGGCSASAIIPVPAALASFRVSACPGAKVGRPGRHRHL